MKYLWLVGVLAGLALFAPAANAGCGVGVVHRGPIVVNSTYHSPVVKYHAPVVHHDVVVKEVVKEVAVPVLVPAFQFQYVPPACPCPQPAPVAPLPPVGGYGAPQAPPGYGQGYGHTPPPAAAPPVFGHGYAAPPQPGVGAGLDNQARIRELAKALLEEMQRQSAQGDDQGPPVVSDPYGSPSPAPATPPVHQLAPATPPVHQPAPAPGQAGPNPNSQWGGVAFAALQRNCAACHTGIGSKGDYQLFSQPGALNPEASLKLALSEIESGRMPPRSSQYRPTPEEVTAIRNWLSGQ